MKISIEDIKSSSESDDVHPSGNYSTGCGSLLPNLILCEDLRLAYMMKVTSVATPYFLHFSPHSLERLSCHVGRIPNEAPFFRRGSRRLHIC